jgi:hypothetical protein
MNRSIFQHARFQPTPDQADQARISDSMFDKSEHPIVIEAPEEVLQIRLQHPANHAAGDDLIEGRQGVMGAELRPAAERAGQEVLLVDGGQHLSRAAAAISDGRPQRACKAQPAQIRTGPIRAYGSASGV